MGIEKKIFIKIFKNEKLKKIFYGGKKFFIKFLKLNFPKDLYLVCAFLNRKVKDGYVNSHIPRLAG